MFAENAREKLIHSLHIGAAAHAWKIKQRRNLRCKHYVVVALKVIQRLDAKGVPSQQNRRILSIQNGKTEHPREPRQECDAPSLPRKQQHFRIRARAESVPKALEFSSDFAIVVDLAVENEVKSAIGSRHRLAGGFGQIDDGQSSVTE